LFLDANRKGGVDNEYMTPEEIKMRSGRKF